MSFALADFRYASSACAAGLAAPLARITTSTGHRASAELRAGMSACEDDPFTAAGQRRGFSSTSEGNDLSHAEQWEKLRVIVDVAGEIWG